MAIYLESFEARHLVGLYFECRKTNTYPSAGSWGQQTAYCTDLFDFLDNVRAVSEFKNAKERLNQSKAKK